MNQEPLLRADFDTFLKKLYEHDTPGLKKPAAAGKRKSGKKAKSGAKYSGRKKPVRQKNTEYKAVFSSGHGDYIAKAGHEAALAQKKYEGMEALFISLKPSAFNLFDVPAEKADTKEMLYEMITGKINESLAYAQELQKTVDYGAKLHSERRAEMLKLEYDNPVFINNQWTYQRIFIQNSRKDSTVYDLTMDKAKAGSLETKVRYDDKFNTVYFDSLNNVKDGNNQAYWEVWVNGRIVEEALDRKQLKKGDVIEWRLANEKEEGCGGGSYRPEFLPKHELRRMAGSYQHLNPLNNFAFMPAYGKASFSYGPAGFK
jgi:hypothetical protein